MLRNGMRLSTELFENISSLALGTIVAMIYLVFAGEKRRVISKIILFTSNKRRYFYD